MCRSAAAASGPRSRRGASISRSRRSRWRCRTSATAACLALAVSGRQRASALPDVPTTMEAGYPNSDYALWLGMFVPVEDAARDRRAAAPGNREGAAVAGVCATGSPALDLEPMPMTPAEFDAFVKDDIVTQGALAKAAGPASRTELQGTREQPGRRRETDMKRLTAAVAVRRLRLPSPAPQMRRTNIRRSRSRSSCLMRRAVRPTSRRALRRAAEEHPRPAVRGREQARRVRHPRHRGNGPLEAGRLHADGRQCLDQRHHADPVQEQVPDRLREERGVGVAAGDLSVVPDHHHGEFQGQERQGRGRLRQEESRQGPLHQRRRRLVPAFRHGGVLEARPASTWCTSPTRPAPPA